MGTQYKLLIVITGLFLTVGLQLRSPTTQKSIGAPKKESFSIELVALQTR
jgi:hypothetical protein